MDTKDLSYLQGNPYKNPRQLSEDTQDIGQSVSLDQCPQYALEFPRAVDYARITEVLKKPLMYIKDRSSERAAVIENIVETLRASGCECTADDLYIYIVYICLDLFLKKRVIIFP